MLVDVWYRLVYLGKHDPYVDLRGEGDPGFVIGGIGRSRGEGETTSPFGTLSFSPLVAVQSLMSRIHFPRTQSSLPSVHFRCD